MHHKIKLPYYGIRLILIILVSSYGLVCAEEIFFESKSLRINNEVYLMEIAKSRQQRQRGLMFRDELGSRNGMLFIYPRSESHRIWMKNTRIKLTVIWLDELGQVLDIQRLEPCLKNPCNSYGVNRPSKYIIELNHQVHKVKVGDKILGLDQF